ncbi:MAG: alanine--glyoxylate aminotransferase family protein [Caldilineaceae bacterium]|nr:alanine--glyoxylate aminotransferase family protein [Caldilineaceae bacterium]MBP8107059.1 alanine--glyoxylate aminotransferase family protein [Caldilineaceae bacterium]MBP8121097.1 alanine--glyoxylate aminotransferase family protein [Caldilineaceae bacterium]MBP9070786.1 alanine--glyoxylate aminotransferase family protein [Caldilineaceae bacterium]
MPTKTNPIHTEKPANVLFIPGPTDVLPDVLAAQTLPMIGHRSDEFEALFAKIQEQLRQLFFTKSRVYVVASSGTGMQEAAIRNAVQDLVLCFVSGAFGQRWHEVAVGCGKQAVRVDVPWGTALKPDQAAEALKSALADGPVEAITVVHNETSTGVMAPVAEIAAAVRAVSPETLILVDAVSSFSGTRIPFDEWGLDLCLTSSQKALAVPPGLAFAAVSDRLLAKAQRVTGRGWYFDFVTLEKYLVKSTTPATPAISLMRALSVQLDHIFAEGLGERFARHHALAQRTQAWAQSRGFALGAEEGYRSPTVTQITNSRGMDIQALNDYLSKQNMEVSDGYGPFKGKAIRIGHMGECTLADLERLFVSIDDFIE